jgi:SAM-dependent methyltransferase
MSIAEPLTTSAQWDDYWAAANLPVEINPGERTSTTAILDVIDRFAGEQRGRSVLEIGGAPGGYLVHLWRRYGHDVCVLDNSPHGIALARENFQLLGVPGWVIEGDLFAPEQPVPQFDLVYSLGLIEHFADTTSVVAAHLEYLRPGGLLIVGCPNFRGLNLALLKRLSPSMLEWHNLDVMDVERWSEFERALDLRTEFRGYVGGFQPSMFWRCERRSVFNRALARALTEAGRRSNRTPFGRALSRRNSSRWSYYALGVYRKPDGAQASRRKVRIARPQSPH